MESRLKSRTNEEWVAALLGEDPSSAAALDELQAYLRRALGKVLRHQNGITEDDLADFAQETLLRLIRHADSFRGDSAFTTWATAVATRVAFTELRRRKVRASEHQDFELVRVDALQSRHARRAPPAEDILSREQLFEQLEHAIETQLSDRQKVAVLAELRGLPTVEIAEKLQTNQNALYKLVHDARKKLRTALTSAGFSPEIVHEHIREAPTR